jgi:glycosyltransferase involved in cell wall biosynthesis/O-antigen/teichoic acid export membrane protein
MGRPGPFEKPDECMNLSLIIPAHNEETRIGPMLDAYLPFFTQRYDDGVEFIVVVNGSSDDTAGVVRQYGSRFPQLHCIVEPQGIGKGGALILGFREARGDLVGFVDADGSTPPAAFQDLIDRIGDADVAVASRWCRGAIVSPPQPLTRRIASRVFNMLTRLLFGLRLTDTQCGAKLMKRDALAPVLDNLGITRWAFDVDLLFQMQRSGRKIVEIPTEWHDVAGSKIDILPASAEMAVALVRLRLMYSPLRWIVGLYDRLIGPFIHPKGLGRDHLFGHSVILLACAQAANITNLLFQASMMRMLDAAEYGTLIAMLGVFAVITMPLAALPWAVAYFTAAYLKDGRVREARGLVSAVTRDASLGGIMLLSIAAVATGPLLRYFNLEGSAPLLLTIAAVAASLGGAAFMGALQGAQGFAWLAGVGFVGSVARLLLAVLLVALGGGATAALFGHAASMGVVAVVAFLGVRHVLGGGWEPAARIPAFYRYCLQYALAYAGYAILMNADVVLVKHYFAADEAGRYAVAAMVGRIILFLPQPIVTAMFPKVVSEGQVTHANWRTLGKAIVLACFVLGGTALFCSLFTQSVLQILCGDPSPDLVPLVQLLVWGMCPLSLTFFIMNFELAQRRMAVVVPLLTCAIVYLACLARWHATPQQVALVLTAAGVVAMISTVVCLPWRHRKGCDEARTPSNCEI